MITYITGVPRAGKSYKAMYTLFANFGKDKDLIKDKKYIIKGVTKALVNINQIDLNKFDNVSYINWDSFYDSLNDLHNLYLSNVNDDELNKLAKLLGVYATLVILDECHNYFDRQDKVLVWWLSYHGHMHQEIILITQNLSLVASKYKGFAEYFYKAYPSSLKLFNNVMKYGEYPESRMSNKNRSGTLKIPIKKEVFSAYGSGKNQNNKSILLKFAIFAIMFFVIGGAILYLIKKSVSNESIIEDKETHIVDTYLPNDKKDDSIKDEEIEEKDINDELLEYKYMSLKCTLKYKYCLYKNKKIQLNTYYKLKEIFDIEELSVTKINNGYLQLDILAKPKFYNIFNGGLENEKNSNSNSLSIFPTN
ncbi:MAG: hypothetical protein C0625_08410 [Arcobacter sp.]|nr:MAG: hypothetical protein C0625_08410 [Arcobacter sp.]